MTKLVMADTRSENAEMDIGRLNVRIDKVVMMKMFNLVDKKSSFCIRVAYVICVNPPGGGGPCG